jgi:hypothetical protein
LDLPHLHVLQEPLLQELHPDEPGFRTPLMPKVENFFLTSSELHFGQVIR